MTRRHDTAFLAGIAYAFAPYRLAQVPHIQMLSGYWTPVCLGALHRYGREPASRWIALAAIAWWMQALSCGYYMFFLSVLLALWMLWFAAGRWTVAMLGRSALAFAAALLLLAPVLQGYQSILRGTYGFSRAADEIRLFSADAAGLLLASEDLLLWGWVHLVLGLLVASVGCGVLAGQTWARIVGVGLVMVHAVVNLAFLSAFPAWSVIAITLDVVVIYALIVHGREARS